MKVFIAGGSGRVAAATIKELVSRGHEVHAGSRHPESIQTGEGVTAVAFDLHADVDTLARQLAGMDAVYFLAGSRGKDLLQTDAFGAVKLMQATKQAGVRRYVQLSSIFALHPEKWAQEPSLASIIDYDIAKFFADDWLMNRTGLDYTIVAPSVLTEEAGTGAIDLEPDKAGTNPIPDVAAVLAEVLERPNMYGKVIQLRGGSTPIADALASL